MQARRSNVLLMDEELKKTIENLSASIKTIQADLLTFKRDREVTHSDENLQAGSQSSNVVSGNGPTKKRKKNIEDESKSEDEDEELELGDTDTELYQLSEAAGAFIETTFAVDGESYVWEKVREFCKFRVVKLFRRYILNSTGINSALLES